MIMIKLLQLLLKSFPWLLSLGLLIWLFLQKTNQTKSPTIEVITNSILTKTESLGKMELVKYNFQEVTELKRIADAIDFRLFKFKSVPDSKAVLISKGSAVGCIDLTRLLAKDITHRSDTIYITLPPPEICYFKINLEESRLYDLQINFLNDEERKSFIQELYKAAENEIKNSAMKTGILDETEENAHSILQPLLESISGKVVRVRFGLVSEDIEIEQERM